MRRGVRTTNAGQEYARRLGLPKEMIELCTTSSAYHRALQEMMAEPEYAVKEYSKEAVIKDATERFAAITRDLHRITSFGSEKIRGAMPAEAVAAPILRVVDGSNAPHDIARLLGGDVTHAAAAPLVARTHSK
jgi:hypothetical protein